MTQQISDAEACIMQVLWERHPLSAEEIAANLATQQPWQLGTVKTLLNRLLNKGAVAAEQDGRRYLYTPLLVRPVWEKQELMSFVDRLFSGRLSPLVAHFSSQRQLSEDDLEALRALLKEQDDQRR